METQKHLFSLDPDVHYLNCAYKAPLLKSAEEACKQALIRDRDPFKIGISEYFDEAQQVRESFGRLVNCAADNVALIPSTSYGFASVLNGLKGKPNGKVITIGNDFPSGYFAAKRWCDEKNNELVVVSADMEQGSIGARWNEKILASIDDRTSMVLLSSVHWMTGLKFDLQSIGKKCVEVGAKFIVDGTQSVGAVPINVQECHIDALIIASYKWLFGPYSLGLMYISDDLLGGDPLEESWMNRANAKEFSNLTTYETKYRSGAGKFNVGETSNFILMPILREGLAQIEKWTVPAINDHCKELIAPLMTYLKEYGVTMEDEAYFSPHLFSLSPPEGVDPDRLKTKLDKERVIVSIRGEHLRVSVNVFNNELDIKTLINIIESTRT